MSHSILSVAGKLHDLAEKAKEHQLASKTTVVKPTDDIPPHRRTVRQTVSLVLRGEGGDPANPTLGLYREPKRGKEKQYPSEYWLAVLGGGLTSVEEDKLRHLAQKDPLMMSALYPDIVDDKGGLQPDAYYQLLGKELLRTGRFPRMTFRDDPERVRDDLQKALALRLKMEIGTTAGVSDAFFLYDLKPEVTPVVGRKFGDRTPEIARRHGLEIDEKTGVLRSTLIEVHERFAAACADLDALIAQPGTEQRLTIMDTEAFIAQAERETASLDEWVARTETPGCLRNHSLIRNVEGLVLAGDTRPTARFRRWWNKTKASAPWSVFHAV